MKYRKEIDGLRALAVLPVILAHAGVEILRGGFVGVDIFFVISGYLITTIILDELEKNDFTIVKFYERRARRILPALFLVMLTTTIAGNFLLMPDEYKNLGQSLVSTSLFSNNILLAITSGYWDLASEFKPLLHTWSLGVEEQYYIFTPIFLMIAWKLSRKAIPLVICITFLVSFLYAAWLVNKSPDWAFYSLLTRAWELAAGGIATIILRSNPSIANNNILSNVFSSIGFTAILLSIVTFNEKTPIPSYPLLLPVLGALLIVIFCHQNTFVHKVLSHKWMVFTGLISYSLYLWHQPFFAFLRAYKVEKPSETELLLLIPIIYIIAFLTWKYIEAPFRKRDLVNRKMIFGFSIAGSMAFIIYGVYLNHNYGAPNRFGDPSFVQKDMDKRMYNERAFVYKNEKFSNQGKVKLLIIGNSFARDFVNITTETFDTTNHEIVYRTELKQCILNHDDDLSKRLYSNADIIVFASGVAKEGCLGEDLRYAKENNKLIFYVGTKYFGYNLNWVIRTNKETRSNLYNIIPDSVINANVEMAEQVPPENYISLLSPTLVDNKIPITDELGRMLSTDRTHLTKYGAIYFGKKAVVGTAYSEAFK